MQNTDSIQQLFYKELGEDAPQKIHTLQSLWSGYGEITRYFSPQMNQNLIVKYINLNNHIKHPRNWHSDFSHERKRLSYHNEMYFYQKLARTNSVAHVPQLYTADTQGDCMALIMEDLVDSGYPNIETEGNTTVAETCVKWLAFFHAQYLGLQDRQIAQQGNYWHLDTRPDEFEHMSDEPLKQNAFEIDEIIKKHRFTTLIHGDAKLANFCFNSDYTQASAVDFQYCGFGVGISDVVYLLGSCFDSEELEQHADNFINRYFQYLNQALNERIIDVDVLELEREWRALIPFVWADFERFLAGWAPNHYKRSEYSERQTSQALKTITESGKSGKSN